MFGDEKVQIVWGIICSVEDNEVERELLKELSSHELLPGATVKHAL